MNATMRTRARTCALILGSALVLSRQAAAQNRSALRTAEPQASHSSGDSKGWRIKPILGLEAEFDDNIFLLSPARRDKPGSSGSGRYADMESASDVIASMSLAAPIKGTGAFGHVIELRPAVRYDLYTKNSKRSNLTASLLFDQDLPRGGQFRVRGSMTPNYFAKNYLSGALDANGDGTITTDERDYRAGTYDETDVSADYRLRLRKATKTSPVGVAVQLGGGFYRRTFEAPFPGRDLSGPRAEIKLLTDITNRVDLDVNYGYAALGADATREVMVIDEPSVGRDVNGNGGATDLNIRIEDLVDRSRNEQSFGAGIRIAATKATDLSLGVDHRARDYTSNAPLDVANNGRRDARNEITAELATAVRKGLRLTAGVAYAKQSLNRSADLGGGGDVDDYSRTRVALGLRYAF